MALFFFGQLSSCNFLAARCSLIAIVTMCRGRVRVACLAHKVTWRKFALCALKHLCVWGCFVFAPVCGHLWRLLSSAVHLFSSPLTSPINDLSRLKLFYGTFQNNPHNLKCGAIVSNNLNTLQSHVMHISFPCHLPQLSMRTICAWLDSNCSCSCQHCRQMQSLQLFPISCTSCQICMLILAKMVCLLVKLLMNIIYHISAVMHEEIKDEASYSCWNSSNYSLLWLASK